MRVLGWEGPEAAVLCLDSGQWEFCSRNLWRSLWQGDKELILLENRCQVKPLVALGAAVAPCQLLLLRVSPRWRVGLVREGP